MDNIYLKGLLATSENLILVIEKKQWERLDSKTWALKNAIELFNKNNVDGISCDMTEEQVLEKYFLSNVFSKEDVTTENFVIERKSTSDKERAILYVQELKNKGFTVKSRTISDLIVVMGVIKKATFVERNGIDGKTIELEL